MLVHSPAQPPARDSRWRRLRALPLSRKTRRHSKPAPSLHCATLGATHSRPSRPPSRPAPAQRSACRTSGHPASRRPRTASACDQCTQRRRSALPPDTEPSPRESRTSSLAIPPAHEPRSPEDHRRKSAQYPDVPAETRRMRATRRRSPGPAPTWRLRFTRSSAHGGGHDARAGTPVETMAAPTPRDAAKRVGFLQPRQRSLGPPRQQPVTARRGTPRLRFT